MPAKINSKIKKILLVVFSFALIFTSLAQPLVPVANAENTTTWYNQGFTDWYSKVYDQNVSAPNEIFGERYTAAQVQWIFYGIVSLPINFIGGKYQDATSCVFSLNPADKIVCAVKVATAIKEIFDTFHISINGSSGSIQDGGNPVAIIFSGYQNRQISGIKYVSSGIKKLISVPEANAQGFGYGAVRGLQLYWTGFRNIAYALTVLVVIIFAFMIMFRVKISPQTVISVQSALPKIFVTLILATFSYAIAGFVIDLTYVVGGFFASLMQVAGFSDTFQYAFEHIVPIESTGFYIFIYMLAYTILFFFAAVWSFFATLLGGFSVYGALASFVMTLVTVWVFILMIWYTTKVPFILLKNLISLYISIVVAPVQIIMGSLIPSIGFSSWFKKILAEAMVFPVTGLFMFLAIQTLINSFYINFAEIEEAFSLLFPSIDVPIVAEMWLPPIVGQADDMAGLLWIAVSFMFILMIPKVIDIMKMLIMGEKFSFGSAISEATGPLKWGQRQITGSPVVRTFQEGIGYSRAANMLQGASNSVFWGNILNKTERFTGIGTKNASDVANVWREKVGQKKVVTSASRP